MSSSSLDGSSYQASSLDTLVFFFYQQKKVNKKTLGILFVCVSLALDNIVAIIFANVASYDVFTFH